MPIVSSQQRQYWNKLISKSLNPVNVAHRHQGPSMENRYNNKWFLSKHVSPTTETGRGETKHMETKVYYDSNPKTKDLSLENETTRVFMPNRWMWWFFLIQPLSSELQKPRQTCQRRTTFLLQDAHRSSHSFTRKIFYSCACVGQKPRKGQKAAHERKNMDVICFWVRICCNCRLIQILSKFKL